MKSSKSFVKDKRAVFGLTSVQAFFGIILGLALLAYVIVVIMGTLDSSNLVPVSTLTSDLVRNESGAAIGGGSAVNLTNTFNYTVANSGVAGFLFTTGTNSIQGRNASSNTQIITSGNYSVSTGGVVGITTAGSAVQWHNVTWSYNYNYNNPTANGADSILTNTSSGVTGFFSAINPVYAILAILVIILVLVVLVRVVSGGNAGNIGRTGSEPQL